MNQDQIETHLRSVPEGSLDGLEDAIWWGVDARNGTERRLGMLAFGQAALALLVVLTSAAWGGAMATQALAEPPALGVFSPHMGLAPSSRLSGHNL